MKSLTSTDWAWLAGFVDGEGSIYLRLEGRKRVKPYHHLRIQITNTRKDVLELIAFKFGGHVNTQGRIPNAGRKPVYRWNAAAKQAEIILKNLYPYLILKKDQAEIGIEFLKTKMRNRKGSQRLPSGVFDIRSNLTQKMYKLNHRGNIN